MTPSLISAIMGSVLIAAGIGLVIYQMQRSPAKHFTHTRSATVSPKEITVKTTYPGLVMIAIGAVMVLAGVVAG